MTNAVTGTLNILEKYEDYIEKACPDFKYFGDEKPIKDLACALSQHGSHSILLSGPAGIGRRSLISGLVSNLASDFMPIEMMNLQVYRLNVQKAFSTHTIVESEKIIKQALDELKKIKQQTGAKPLLVIDDGSTLAREISDKRASSILNMIEAADVDQDDFDLILSVDNDALHNFKTSYSSFLTHFIEQDVEEMKEEYVIEMLNHEAERYDQYGVTIDGEAIQAIVDLCKKYTALADFSMPKRASRFMDEVATAYRHYRHAKPEGIQEDEDLLAARQQALNVAQEQGADTQDIESEIEALEIGIKDKSKPWDAAKGLIVDAKATISKLQSKLAENEAEIERIKQANEEAAQKAAEDQDAESKSFGEIDDRYLRDSDVVKLTERNKKIKDEIALENETITKMISKVVYPITLSAEYVEEYAKTKLGMNDVPDMDDVLLTLEDDLNNVIFGQESMIAPAVAAIKNRHEGLDDCEGPIANILVLGPPGTGKTYFAKKLAEFAFGSGEKLNRFQMQYYMKDHEASKLIGAPPGYAGYDTEPEIIRAFKKNPAGVNLWDEIEKAHDDILLRLLTTLEDGTFEAANGKDVADFSECINMMASNYGKELFLSLPYEEACEAVQEKFKSDSKFPPEFRSRCQLVFAGFHNDETLMMIMKREVASLNERIAKKYPDFKVVMDEQSIANFIKKEYDPALGARKVEKAFKNDITVKVSDEILKTKKAAKESGIAVKDIVIAGAMLVSVNEAGDLEFNLEKSEAKTLMADNENNAASNAFGSASAAQTLSVN